MRALLVAFLTASPGHSDHERTLRREIQGNLSRVFVVHSSGDCWIYPLPEGAPAHAELKIAASGDNTSQEVQYLERIVLEVAALSDGGTRVQSLFPPADSKPPALSYAAELKVWLPVHGVLQVDSRFGAVEVSGRVGPVTIWNRLGPVTVKDIAGAVTVTNEYDQVLVEQVAGDVLVHNSQEVRVAGVQGRAEVHNKFGAVRLEKIERGVLVENRNAPIDLEGIQGGAEIRSSYSRISIVEVEGAVTITGGNADVRVRRLIGNLSLEYRHGVLDLEDVRGSLTLHGGFVTLTARLIQGDVVLESPSSPLALHQVTGNVQVEGADGAIEIRDVLGSLQVTGSGALLLVSLPRLQSGGSITMDHHGGPLELELPPDGSFRLAGRSNVGIDAQIPGVVLEQSGRVKSATLQRGDGSTRIEVQCVDGVLRLLPLRAPP